METLRNTGLLALLALAVALAFYIGITNDLCTRIHTYSTQEQAAMKLDAKACAKPWYAKL